MTLPQDLVNRIVERVAQLIVEELHESEEGLQEPESLGCTPIEALEGDDTIVDTPDSVPIETPR